MSWTFTSYGTPEDPAQLVDHLELSFKPLMRLAEIAEYVDHHQEIPEPYREAIRGMALDTPIMDGLFAFSDLLEVARNTAGELHDETWRELNPEKAAEVDALTAENGDGDGSEAGLSDLQDAVLTLARIAALSARQTEGRVAERVLGEVNIMAEDQFRRSEDALAELEEGFNISDRTQRWSKQRVKELAAEVEERRSEDNPSSGSVVFWPEWLEDGLSKHLEAVTGLQERMDDNGVLCDLRTTPGKGDPGMVAWGAEYVLRGVKNRLASVLECPQEHADTSADATVGVLWELGSELALVWAGTRSVDGAGDLAENLLQEARALKQLGTRVDEESAKWRSQGRPPLRGDDAA